MMKRWYVLAASLALTGNSSDRALLPERVMPNDNRTPAGTLRNGVLTLNLEAREGLWYPDGDAGPGLVLQMFAEVGRTAQNPGPLIRVPAGSRLRVSIRNALRDSVLVLHGFRQRPSSVDDTVQVAPGRTREVSFLAGAPGTYFYWGTTTHQPVGARNGVDSQLHGAFIVDPPGMPPPADRIFVLGSWTSSEDSAGIRAELRVINGLSWPNTERFTYSTGDTVRWRWVNPTDSPHPMHLHGFYFDVVSRGTWARDSAFSTGDAPHVVTEMPLSGQTFEMRWVPREAGNWLFHCHVAFHTSMFLSAKAMPDPDDPIAVDPMNVMRGMVLAVTVNPGVVTANRPTVVTGARAIRLIAQYAPMRYRNLLDEMSFVRQDGPIPPASDSVPMPSSMLVLRRNEPVRITIVNRLRGATAVHWHGIEVPSYSDGVPGWSGSGSQIASAIAPGDSFVAAFTPPRSGTFIYHAHANESFQVNLGLYGALLVVDSTFDAQHERVIILGGNGPGGLNIRINGRERPDTVQLTVGETYRIRLIHIIPDWTARIAMVRDDSAVHWRALAKDGAELPARSQLMRAAEFIAGPGETMDFEFRPSAPGLLRLLVEQREGIWKTQLPIRIER
jgi:FtsP/CotA-like multicopper oxidase with cupredoxin domain